MSPWLSYLQSPASPRARLLCLPYAGGSASAFREWQSLVPAGVEVLVAQYPGRERRWKEAPATRMEALVHDLRDGLAVLPPLPYVSFGHSMGALVAFALARSLEIAGLPGPSHLFVSASAAPGVAPSRDRWRRLDDAALVEALRALNGLPEEALAMPELLEVMLPVIRADLELAGTYAPVEQEKVSCGLTALGGLEDPSVSRDALGLWAQRTSSPGGVRMFQGDHFYLRKSLVTLLTVLLRPLSPILRG